VAGHVGNLYEVRAALDRARDETAAKAVTTECGWIEAEPSRAGLGHCRNISLPAKRRSVTRWLRLLKMRRKTAPSVMPAASSGEKPARSASGHGSGRPGQTEGGVMAITPNSRKLFESLGVDVVASKKRRRLPLPRCQRGTPRADTAQTSYVLKKSACGTSTGPMGNMYSPDVSDLIKRFLCRGP
jgi:hypothetical protein